VTAAGEATQPATATVEVEAVSRWYGNVVAVNDISFTLAPGITALLGPNGAGKSTVLHMIAGFLRASRGTVRVLGQPAFGNPEIYRDVGLVPEREAVYSFLTGYEFVLMTARLHGLIDAEGAARRAIRAVDGESFEKRKMGGYSKGMKQRIKVAAGIVHDPKVLLLDEPFNGTDPAQRLQMMDMLRGMAAEGKVIVFSSHILEEVERLADNIVVIVAGRLAASGDFRAIRRLMTDRPYSFTVRSSDNRGLAVALLGDPSVFGVELDGERMTVRTALYSEFVRAVPRVARRADITLRELIPADESLESVFSYLVTSSSAGGTGR
jgi:ABC-2 type transport system ATP-binding protein